MNDVIMKMKLLACAFCLPSLVADFFVVGGGAKSEPKKHNALRSYTPFCAGRAAFAHKRYLLSA